MLLLIHIIFTIYAKKSVKEWLKEVDPVGLETVLLMTKDHQQEINNINKILGNKYSKNNDDENNNKSNQSRKKESEEERKQRILDMNSPITPTDEERLVMKNNNPVVIPYLVRPEQMLLLMKHE